MMPAAKHLDPFTGVDTHIVLIPTPAGPVPTPVPHPHVGILFDPKDYVPKLGASIFVNGRPRAIAGTAGIALVPHVPMGGPFAKPPTNESQMFMGSSTVLGEGEPLSYAMLPVLTCQDIGMPSPPRAKKPSAKSLMLPTALVMPIPAGPAVLVGGAPTINMTGFVIGAAQKALGKALKKALQGKRYQRNLRNFSRIMHHLGDKALDKLKIGKESRVRNFVHRNICTVTGHPVDIASGKMFTDFVDLELPGPFPYKLERVWYSTSTYAGALGHGWHASFDMALAASERTTGVRLADGRSVLFPRLALGKSHFEAAERLTLARDDRGYTLHDAAQGLSYRFAEVRARRDTLPLIEVRDRSGFTVRFQYDERGQLARIVDSGGRPWDLTLDGSGRVTSIQGIDPRHPERKVRQLAYAYDDLGNLCEVRDALGHAQRFVYQRHLLVKETNRNGLSFYFEYDGRDEAARCVRTWGDGGIYDHKLRYDGKTTVVENSLGHKTTYLHDGAMVHKTIDAFGNFTRTEYDAGYRVTMQVDELGQPTLFKYDERGNLLERTAPDGAKLCVTYGPHDLPLHAVDALGGAWSWSYDARGRVVERKDPLGRVTRLHYHAQWLVGVTDPAGGFTAFGFDPHGNLDAVGSPAPVGLDAQQTANPHAGAVTRYEHDALGRVVAITDPKGNVLRRELDLLGRVTRVHEPDGNQRALQYDREGNVVHAKDLQHDVRFTYQGMNRLASRSEAGTTVKFQYDTEEQLTGIVNEHGHVYRFTLGPTGQVDEEHGFDGLMRRYTRDKAGRVTRVDRPDGRFSEFKLDPAGRVTRATHADQSVERYAYRLDGALIHASSNAAVLAFERDALGRVLKECQSEHWVEYEYDQLGQRTRMRSSLGAELELTRNLMGDVTALREQQGFEARFERDLLGLELERTLPGGLKSRWERDPLGRPVQHTVHGERGTLRDLSYHWEPNDRLRQVIDALEGPTQYRHDALGNLAWGRYADGQAELRMPDAVGNLFKREDRKDRAYGPAGQLLAQSTSRGEIHYAYDPEGNLIEKREPGGRVWRYAWNGAGMLANVTRPDGTEVTFGYDALGRRVRKTYRGQTTKWVWDGDVPLHEWVEGKLAQLPEPEPPWPGSADPVSPRRDAELAEVLALSPSERGSKQAPITWLFEPESFAPMAKLVGREHFSIVTDHLGAPVLMADARGRAVWGAQYSVYGELRALQGPRHACPFRWPGQYEDLETGLYYNRFRYYDAEAGQYASQDPIGLAGGAALYAYVHDPVAWVDPLGLSGNGGCDGARRTSRSAAFREAKARGGVPRSQQPSGMRHEPLRDQPGHIQSREYDFVRGDGANVTIREHSLGHTQGNHGPHFNVEVRPAGGGPRQALVSGADSHVYFEP